MTPRKWKILSRVNSNLIGVKSEKVVDILLGNRGINTRKEKEEFLNPSLAKVTIEKVGISKSEVLRTIKRIRLAIEKNEKIIIYGDYDVDGISGTAILWETLFEFYRNVTPYIPHRMDEGYGLSIRGIEHILSENQDVGLIITVDNGIVANGAVDFANKNGIDIVITDHHVKGKKIPKAFSIVHATKLCGAGIAYLLSQEIRNSKFEIRNKSKIPNTQYSIPDTHLELAALATVADLVPLNGANRAIVKFGIEALRKTKRFGLLELYQEAGIKPEDIGVYEIGHIIAPRLNATGRVAHALDSLRLICTKDRDRAKNLASYLSETNKNRQVLTKESTLHAESISKHVNLAQKFIFVQDPNYNQGVIGLIASRLVETYYKPAVVISRGEIYSKGSARSISGFNIIEFLREFRHLLVDAGGHPMAAGFTIETQKIEKFKKAIIEHSTKIIPDALLTRIITIDLEIDFSLISEDLFYEIQKLAPFGIGNPEPVFLSRKAVVEDMSFVGKEQKHLKMKLVQNNIMFDSILFRAVDNNIRLGDKVDVVYSIEDNSWNGRSKIQLKIKDLKTNY